jgi:hypothetical protein
MLQKAHKVAIYAKQADADNFISALRAGLRQRQSDFQAGRIQPYSPGEAHVKVFGIDQRGAQAFAAARQSHAHPAEAFLFLNRGAVHACKELGLRFPSADDTTAPNKEIPAEAKLLIDATFRTAEPYAEISGM